MCKVRSCHPLPFFSCCFHPSTRTLLPSASASGTKDQLLKLQVVDSASAKGLEDRPCWSILIVMAENLLEFAQKLAQAARAGLAVERKRLQEILAERQRKQPAQPSQQSR